MAGVLFSDHILRRAGLGVGHRERALAAALSPTALIDRLVNFDRLPDDVDTHIGEPGYAGVTARGQFSPNTVIDDARQRWLFRMVHTDRPLQERMALFWHNHFATAYSKIAGTFGAPAATRMLAGKPGEVAGPPGQYELFRQHALGSFRDLLLAVARDPAMLVWLDGRLNTRARPQENFAREIMELFTWGVGHYTEADVVAAARVFTGWNLRANGNARDPATGYYEYVFNSGQHDTAAKTFTFPVYPDGNRTIPARSGAAGEQDGVDFINALATHRETARSLARKLWGFFISEFVEPHPTFVEEISDIYQRNDTRMLPVVSYILSAGWFPAQGHYYARYSWPVEFVVRAIKEVGWVGFSVDAARSPLTNMGQTLFEPPDVAGWSLGPAWFGTSAMLARMNFAATLAGNQKFNLGREAAAARSSPESLLAFFLDRLTPTPLHPDQEVELLNYVRAGGAWTGSEAQLNTRGSGLARLILASGEYQFI
ncbi:MAG: DUF1800 domain-containing protein [Acidimicrobiia bacterium]|nr:DUF1800 domain-containing protein [Acidimicrobiia bacterium]